MMPLVLITGASGGIGQALARRYAAMNYRLALVVRQSNDVENWLKSMSISIDSYQIYSADVTQPFSMAEMARACLARQGVPDIVIANAGISIGMDASVADDMAVLQTILQTNVFGVAYTFQPFIVPMRTRGSGTLVGLSAWRVFVACQGMVAIAPARQPSLAIAKACAVNCAEQVSR